MLEQTATDAADQCLSQGRAVIGTGHDHIDRQIDRTRKQDIVDWVTSLQGLVDPCR